jgi:hypothetical protein
LLSIDNKNMARNMLTYVGRVKSGQCHVRCRNAK